MSHTIPYRPRLSIQLLGETRFLRDGAPWKGKHYDKVTALLAYLAVEADRSHSREHLASLLWHTLPADAARTNLRQSLYYLRQLFGADADTLLLADRESVRFNYSPSHCWIDVKTLTEQAPTCHKCPTAPMSPPCEHCLSRLKSRADSYQGEFLAGLTLADAPDFDVWLDAQRQSLRGRAFSCAERLRNAYETLARPGPAIAYAQRCVQLEPWNEAGHREHMRLLAMAGQHGTAEAMYDAFRDTLARDLNVEPEQSTHTLFETIHKGELEPQQDTHPVEPLPFAPETPTGRRQATILCCHLDQSSAAPRESIEQLAQARSLCATILRRHAGHITLGQGGHLYAYIGYPQASEHAGELAVQASLELQSHFSDRYRFRVGIHTGIILAGFDPALPDIVGNVSAIAWRLCKRLQKSGIAVSEPTRLLLHGRFKLDELSPLLITTEDAPNTYVRMPAHKLIGPSPIAAPNVAAATSETALIGRKAELRRLKDLWDGACSGDPQFLVISGEPGMGKTHLAAALHQLIDAGTAIVRHLHCYPERQHTPLYPVIGLLESIMGFSVDDTTLQQQEKLTRYLKLHHPAIARQATPLLLSMLAIAAADTPVLSPRQRKLQTLDMLLTLLDSMTLRQPMLLLIEDAQWLDVTSRDLLERLVHRRDRHRLFTLLTARPEFRPSWLHDDSVMQLTPLKEEHIAKLARAVSNTLPRHTVERIVQRADGIPLYAEEMARIGVGDQEDAIPTTLHYMLLTRLDTVPHARRLLQLAATLGRTFEKELLQRISTLSEDKLEAILGELVEARLITPLSRDNVYQFHHALIQEAAYGSQILPDKRAAHLKAAKALEFHSARRAVQRPGELARHYTAAGDARAAIPWWLLSGRQALRVSACAEAADELQLGLNLIPSLPSDAQRNALELKLLLALGQALLLLRGYGSEEAAKVYDQALALDDSTVPIELRFDIFWGQWMVSSSRKGSSFLKSWELTQRLLRLAHESGNANLLAQAYSAAANISVWSNRLEKACHFAKAAMELPGGAFRDASEGLDPHVTSLAHLSWALWRLERIDEALAASNESVKIARTHKNPDTLCFALAFAALLHRFLGNAGSCVQYAHELRREAGLHAMVLWIGVGDMLLAWKQAYDGNPAGLARLNARLRDIQMVMPGVAAMFFHALADAYGLLGRRTQQLRIIDEGLRAAGEVQEGFFSSLLLDMRRECLERQTLQ
ncbi:AAA family ATPase [Pusillimonas sp.]|uniref:AAA family ATPase n=1 Tax=Pusillimonas sp. TaxID=3040095 RepID=UPI0037C679C3